jgi:hypothetical protein
VDHWSGYDPRLACLHRRPRDGLVETLENRSVVGRCRFSAPEVDHTGCDHQRGRRDDCRSCNSGSDRPAVSPLELGHLASNHGGPIPLWSPHDLRHRRVSLLHLRGVPWARIGEWVGQRNLAVTADTYTHVLTDETELDYRP